MKPTFFNEMYDEAAKVRPHYKAYAKWLGDTPAERIARKRAEADIQKITDKYIAQVDATFKKKEEEVMAI